MRKVGNAGVIRRLSMKSFRESRTRNRIAAIAILLTAVLFTAVFTIGIGLTEHAQRSMMEQAGGDAHGAIKGLSQEQYEILREHPLIRECGRDVLVAYGVKNPEFLKRHVEMHYIDPEFYGHWFLEIVDGRAPETADEILLDERSMALLGLEPKAGQQVTLDVLVHALDPDTVPRRLTVSGVLRAKEAMNVGFAIVSEAYLEEHAGEMAEGRTETVLNGGETESLIAGESSSEAESMAAGGPDGEPGIVSAGEPDGEQGEATASESDSGSGSPSIEGNGADWDGVGEISMQIVFADSSDIQGRLNRVITESGFSTDRSAPGYIESNANWAYLSESAGADPMTVIGIAGAVVLILVAGYLIIYNVFQISVLRDIRYYGLLKTIGTTGRQIRRILRRQALLLCLMGIPAGLLIGYFGGALLLPVMLPPNTGEREVQLVSPHLWIFAGAAVFTVLTVLISEWKPARVAARVSPVEALRYTDQTHGRKKGKRSTDGGKLWRMAFSNLGRSRMRTAVVICSLSLTIVLLNSIYTVTHSIDRAGFLSKMILSEDLIGNAALWNYNYRPYDEESAAEVSLTESFVSAVQGQESYLDGGRIYQIDSAVSMPVESWRIPDYIPKNVAGAPVDMTPEGPIAYNGYEEGAYRVALHGIEPFVVRKMEVAEGETDPDALWEKLASGKYLLYAAPVDDNNVVVEDELLHHAGDSVTLQYPDGTEKTYEIAAVTRNHTFSLTNRMSSNFTYYVAAKEFQAHLSDAYLMNFLFDVKEGQEDAMEEFLEDYTEHVEPQMSFESRKTYEGSFREIIGMITLVGTALTVVVGLIGLLNFVNAVLTGMVTRAHEFAMMEAIGMTRGQLVRMLMAEGIFYALLTAVTAAAAGTLFSVTALRAISGGIWFMRYRFTLLPLLLTCPVLLALGALIPKAAYALQKKQSIVEGLRE